jgi:hypothetical protein
MKKNIIVILAMLLFVSCNNGWHYETEIKAGNGYYKLKLYSKTINGNTAFQVKDEIGQVSLVTLNDNFGKDGVGYEYDCKYKACDHFPYYFNMPGEDVTKELEEIQKRRYEGWEYVGNIKAYYPRDLTNDGVRFEPGHKIKSIYLKQWVKVVNGKKYYLVGTSEIRYADTPEPNPFYKEDSFNECKKVRWRVIYPALALDLQWGVTTTEEQIGVFFDLL